MVRRGALLPKEDWPLHEIQLREWRGLVFVAFAPEQEAGGRPPGLIAELAHEPIETYRAVREERLVFDANWKIYTDNFVEGYPSPASIPASTRPSISSNSRPPRRVRAHDDRRAKELFYRGKWLWMWPNWTCLFEGGMNTSRINPLGHDRTELIYNFYFADPSRTNTIEDTIQRNLAVVREDFGICIETHKNYAAAPIQRGRSRRITRRACAISRTR